MIEIFVGLIVLFLLEPKKPQKHQEHIVPLLFDVEVDENGSLDLNGDNFDLGDSFDMSES